MVSLRILMLFFSFNFVFVFGFGFSSEKNKCVVPEISDYFVPHNSICSLDYFANNLGFQGILGPSRVSELDELLLERAVTIFHKSDNAYNAILFYASWCPFSNLFRPTFNLLSAMYPTIHHIAVEETGLRPSILSRYGVHSFPMLVLQSQTTKVAYHGPRNLESLIKFYSAITGIQAVYTTPTENGNDHLLIDFSMAKEDDLKTHCPYSWAQSPDKLLQQDTYLMLAVLFLVVRMCYWACPKLLPWLKAVWERHVWPENHAMVENSSPAFVERMLYILNFKRTLNNLIFCKKSNLQAGAKNATAWASKSLASVKLGEGSSSKVVLSEGY